MVSVAVVATIQGNNEISENLFDEDHHTDILAAIAANHNGVKFFMKLNSILNGRCQDGLKARQWTQGSVVQTLSPATFNCYHC